MINFVGNGGFGELQQNFQHLLDHVKQKEHNTTQGRRRQQKQQYLFANITLSNLRKACIKETFRFAFYVRNI